MTTCRMMRWMLCVLCLLTAVPASGQIVVGLGYQQGFFRMENADKPIDRFNANGFLFRDMNRFRWPGGEIYMVGIRHNRFMGELTMNTRRARASAESFAGNVLQRRDTRFSMQAFGLSGSYAVVDAETFVLYPVLGIDLGYVKMSTRTGDKASIGQQDYYPFDRRGLVALTAKVQMVFRANREAITSWSLSPYLHYPLRKYDFWVLNPLLLAPSAWYLDGATLPSRAWSAGVSLTFELDLLHFLM